MIRVVRWLLVTVVSSVVLAAAVIFWAGQFWTDMVSQQTVPSSRMSQPVTSSPVFWRPPDISRVLDKARAEEILYGKELVAHTSRYLGPMGSVGQMSNGMNCQNCHLDAGTKTFGNNYGAVASTYPKFRARSGSVESVVKRVNDCFERSLNGQALDSNSREMRAIVSYIEWLGSEVAQGEVPSGAGLAKMKPLDRAADPAKGKLAYESQCSVCHGTDGQGVKVADGSEYQFPPLWGKNSYNQGAGLYRLSNFAQFIRPNMPLGVSHDNPLLSEEQAWDIAAYVNSLPRPTMDISQDWPDVSLKPFDHPFGPYVDPFSEEQHKFGPFEPIRKFYADRKSK